MNANSEPLDERYFEWLYAQVGIIRNRNPERSHWLLCELMFKTEYDGWLPNDHNRASDGRELRYEFIEAFDLKEDPNWLEIPCSIFEMLVGLSRRASFQSFDHNRTSYYWFWKMCDNLEIRKYTDERWNDGIAEAVSEVLSVLNSRAYESNGQGGLFPLRNPPSDQTQMELWYQLSAYLLENDELNEE